MKMLIKRPFIFTSLLLASNTALAASCNELRVTAPQNATEFTVLGTNNANILHQEKNTVLLERISIWRGGGMIHPLKVTVFMKKGNGSTQKAEIKQAYCFTQSGGINVDVQNKTPLHDWAEPKSYLAEHGVLPGRVEFN